MGTQFVVQTGEDIFWRLEASDPLWIPLAPVLPALLLNPLAAARASDMLGHQLYGPWMLADGATVLSTQRVLLAWTEPLSADGFPAISHGIPQLIASLRHLAGQYHLPAVVQIGAVARVEEKAIEPVWPVPVETTGHAREDLVTRAIPFASVPAAVQMTAAGGPPVFSAFFLDGLKAQAAGYWRMALLLAALAVETGAAEALAEWHAARLAALPRPAGVVAFQTAGGGTTVKDPVHDALAEKTSFKLLLHERPLHLAQRSLLIEDEDTYRRALKLYATRNKIAHLGGPGVASTSCYQLVDADVREAIEVAIRCLQFFGKGAPSPAPRGGMVAVLPSRVAGMSTLADIL